MSEHCLTLAPHRRAPALRRVAARRLTGDLARLGHSRSHLTPTQDTNVSAYWKLNLNFEENQYIMLCRASSIASSGPGQLMAWPEVFAFLLSRAAVRVRAVVRPGVAPGSVGGCEAPGQVPAAAAAPSQCAALPGSSTRISIMAGRGGTSHQPPPAQHRSRD